MNICCTYRCNFKYIILFCLTITLLACGGGGSGGGEAGGSTGSTGGTGGSGGGTGGGGSGGSTVIVSATNPSDYVWASLTSGTNVYIDRSYTYSTIPSAYQGFKVLQTANDDKTSMGDAFISFNIDQSVTGYVAHANNGTGLPSWLTSWANTGNSVVTTDRTLFVYKKDFSAGTVVLGGNEGGDSMYTVFISTPGTGSGGGGTANGVTLTVSWNPNSDAVNGYAVYYGGTPSTATQLASTIPITTGGFNPTAPSVAFDSAIDLKKSTGEQVCFTIKAYNGAGYSGASGAACITI